MEIDYYSSANCIGDVLSTELSDLNKNKFQCGSKIAIKESFKNYIINWYGRFEISSTIVD